MVSTPVGRLRLFSLLEALTYLVLIGFSVNKNVLDGDHLGVQIMGPLHGVLFVFYVLAALDVRPRLGWSVGTTAKVLIASVIPFAPFFVERWLRTQQETPELVGEPGRMGS